MTIHHDYTDTCCEAAKYQHHSDYCASCGKPPYIPDWIIADRIARALSSPYFKVKA